jgi:Undecaprenyl-phosphate galactose phosphotransferase WbaP
MMKKKVITLAGLVVSDCLAVFLSGYLAFLIRAEFMPLLFPSMRIRPVLLSAYISRAYMIIVWLAVFSYEKLYTKRHAFWEETRFLIKGSTISFALIMVAVFVTKAFFPISRAVILFAWLLSLPVLSLSRYLTKTLLIRFGLWRKKVIIIGSTESASAIITAIRQNPTMGYDIVGCLTEERWKIGMAIAGVPILGHYDDIEDWKKRTGFEDIIVTFPNVPRDQLIGLLRRWDGVSDTIRYIPQTGDLITTGIEIENIGRVLALAVRKNLHKPWNIFVKEVFEFVLAVVMLAAALPLFAAIALAIKLDSRGPVFFKQERFGKRGQVINVFKFRSMRSDADARLKEYFNAHPEARYEWVRYKKIKDHDPRVTRVGRVLRRFSLDELPQLWNVLRREMSLVGPRPYIQEELDQVKQIKSILLQVKPGITGLWQTSGRSLVPFRERLSLDEYYIRNWSLWRDVAILMKTVKVMVTGRGAF